VSISPVGIITTKIAQKTVENRPSNWVLILFKIPLKTSVDKQILDP
jgi:hypothetical protein